MSAQVTPDIVEKSFRIASSFSALIQNDLPDAKHKFEIAVTKFKVDIDYSDDKIDPPLTDAITFCNSWARKELLKRGADVKKLSRDKTSALHAAVSVGDEDAVRDLLDYKANAHVFCSANLLIYALDTISELGLLQNSTINMDESRKAGHNPELARELSDFFFQRGQYVVNKGEKAKVFSKAGPIHAHYRGKTEILGLLLSAGVSPSTPSSGSDCSAKNMVRDPLKYIKHFMPGIIYGQRALRFIELEADGILKFQYKFVNKTGNVTTPIEFIVHYDMRPARAAIEAHIESHPDERHIETLSKSMDRRLSDEKREAWAKLHSMEEKAKMEHKQREEFEHDMKQKAHTLDQKADALYEVKEKHERELKRQHDRIIRVEVRVDAIALQVLDLKGSQEEMEQQLTRMNVRFERLSTLTFVIWDQYQPHVLIKARINALQTNRYQAYTHRMIGNGLMDALVRARAGIGTEKFDGAKFAAALLDAGGVKMVTKVLDHVKDGLSFIPVASLLVSCVSSVLNWWSDRKTKKQTAALSSGTPVEQSGFCVQLALEIVESLPGFKHITDKSTAEKVIVHTILASLAAMHCLQQAKRFDPDSSSYINVDDIPKLVAELRREILENPSKDFIEYRNKIGALVLVHAKSATVLSDFEGRAKVRADFEDIRPQTQTAPVAAVRPAVDPGGIR